MTVEEVLVKHKLFFVPSGRDFLIKCLNPNHEDNNPSMRVDKVTGIFHCFSCGHKGNILTQFGVDRSRLEILRQRVKARIEKISVERVGFQIPEDAVFWEAEYRNISAETLKKFKAFTYEEEWPNRLVFPLYDITGKISNFCARSFDPFAKPKYKFYPPHSASPLFPMKQKPKFGTIILVEGIFDLLNLYDNGIPWVMTCFGTQTVNEEKLSLLRLLGVTDIHFLFDGDDAGQEAAKKAYELADSRGFVTRNIDLRNYYDEGADPGSLTKKQIERLKNKEWPEY